MCGLKRIGDTYLASHIGASLRKDVARDTLYDMCAATRRHVRYFYPRKMAKKCGALEDLINVASAGKRRMAGRG